jgi:hypothetical protein
MPPTEYPYRAHILRRRVWASAFVVGMGALYFLAARPIQWRWFDITMLAIVGLYAVRLAYSLVGLRQPPPKVIISGEGLRDPALGSALIPWSAIKEIKVSRSRGLWQLFLVADSQRLSFDPGGLSLRIANRIRGARAGRRGPDIALAMTPSAALDAALDDVLQDIRSRPSAASIAIDESGTSPSIRP